jgi:hypothetical protein
MMRKYGWQVVALVIGLLLSLAMIGVFSVRAARHASFRRVDESIRPWMTLPYIAHSYKVPVMDLYRALNLTPVLHDRRTVMKLSKDLNLPLSEVNILLQEAIVNARPKTPTPQPQAPPTP